MSYQVLARKWRPKNFSELVGQPAVCQTLINGLKAKRLYPVLLFTGPRGTGKTSTARILAKSLRCENQKEALPCDQCENCLLIGDSRHLDVIEIDGASNNGVDAVRELRDTVAYMPSTGQWKIYIIDEVHMLSNSAFNALLKTLEEPPDHVLFIMATTESHKIPLTVLSRTQKLDFHLLSPTLIKKQLENICKKEQWKISDDILWVVAKQAQGSLRDAQSLLDQVITFCGEDLNRETVTQLLGLSDPQLLFQCLQALVRRKEEDMIKVISGFRIKGLEPRLFLQNLIESLSQFLFLKKNPSNQPALVQASDQEIELIKKEIESISYEDLHFLFDMLLKGEREMALCHDGELVLEVLLLRFCSAPRLESIVPLKGIESNDPTQMKGLLKNDSASYTQNKIKQNPSAERENQKSQKQSPLQKNITASSHQKTEQPENNTTKTFFAESKIQQTNTSSDEGDTTQNPSTKPIPPEKQTYNFEKRFDFLEQLRKKEPTLVALLENLGFKKKSSKHFCLIVPEKFFYLKNKITEPSFQKILERELSQFLNSTEKIKIEVLSQNNPTINLKQEKQKIEKDKLISHVNQNAFVDEIKTLFEGEIKSVTKS